ncbi:hypothetical protein BRADI_4g14226v3 [Brachypodium distachyon]|uniref:Uncharacterized protein n=1 Tax=Brachypodium distachyon TaxID=15368 RepID=A0A2K2CMS5_BRADI|nr:hypothetical protein BRADI_4g14226v3 [Brachypodium distachyon]
MPPPPPPSSHFDSDVQIQLALLEQHELDQNLQLSLAPPENPFDRKGKTPIFVRPFGEGSVAMGAAMGPALAKKSMQLIQPQIPGLMPRQSEIPGPIGDQATTEPIVTPPVPAPISETGSVGAIVLDIICQNKEIMPNIAPTSGKKKLLQRYLNELLARLSNEPDVDSEEAISPIRKCNLQASSEESAKLIHKEHPHSAGSRSPKRAKSCSITYSCRSKKTSSPAASHGDISSRPSESDYVGRFHRKSRPSPRVTSEVRRSSRIQEQSRGFKRDYAAMAKGKPTRSSPLPDFNIEASGLQMDELPTESSQHLKMKAVPDPITLQLAASIAADFCGVPPGEV